MISFKFNKLNIDFYPSTIGFQNKTVILLLGIPSKPREYDIINKFNKLGFDFLMPHYEGTWNSEGDFLERHPSLSIDELISVIPNGIQVVDESYTSENIYVIGSSFGGWVGWALKDTISLKKVCLTSPVISFKKVIGIETLFSFLNESFPNDYRLSQNHFNELINDKVKSPEDKINLPPEKIMVLAGKNDDQINYVDIENFAKEKSITNIYIEDSGHVTPSRLTTDQFDKIIEFFKG